MIVLPPLQHILDQTTPSAIDKAARTHSPPSAFAVLSTPPCPGDEDWGATTSIILTAPALRELTTLLTYALSQGPWRPPCSRALLARLRSLSPSRPSDAPTNPRDCYRVIDNADLAALIPTPPCECPAECSRAETEACPHA